MSDNDPVTKGDLKQAFIDHGATEKANSEEQLERFMAAFPDGDPLPHRAYHQAKIDAAKAEKAAEESRKKMYDTAISKIAEKGIEGIFGVAKILVVIGLATLALKLGWAFPSWLVK